MSRGVSFRAGGLLARTIFAVALATAIVLWCAPARGQANWEYSPYQVQVLLAFEATPQLPRSLAPAIGQAVAARAEAVFGAIWQVEIAAPPPALTGEILSNLSGVTADQLVVGLDRKQLEQDKIYLAAVRWNEGTLAVAVRELDCRSRQLGPLIKRSTNSQASLPLALWDALAESFTPLARIEQVEERKIVARLRAGGLAEDAAGSPALAEAGMTLKPIIRRNDRTGQPGKGGVQPIPFSLLSVDRREGSVLECTLHSGYRTAIPPRGGLRVERLALLMRGRFASTRLVLRSRTEPTKPLVGYEVYFRGEKDEDTRLIGATDLHGAISIPRGDGTPQTLVVKNGKQLLARLPLVPGQDATLTAEVVDDDGRLEAEGFVAALSSRGLDLVARREILAARIRARLKEGKPADAQQLLDQFRRLETRAELNRDLDQYRQQVSASDKLTQARIDRLFSEAQKIFLLKPLSDELLVQLTREVTAKAAGG